MKLFRRYAVHYDMKKGLIIPVIVASLFGAGCDGNSTAVDTSASVRFFNAVVGTTGGTAFTMNGQIESGSAISFGQSTQNCSAVDAGSTSFGFGAASLNNQSIVANGNYTVVATGSVASPTLFLLDNKFTGSLSSNQAAVRFVNLAPGVSEGASTFTVLSGTIGSTPTTVFATDIAVGAPTAFSGATGGANSFTVLTNHDVVISGNAATLNFEAGTVNTIAIVPNTSGGFQLINIPRCA